MINLDIDKFEEKGWIIVDIPKSEYIFSFVDKIQYETNKYLGGNSSLKTIDKFIKNIDDLKIFQNFLTNYLWDNEFSVNFIESIKSITDKLIGLNIMVQYKPFLRVARPNNREDNIGYHKDTQYGQSPFELAVHVPFVDLDKNSSLQVISGSHLHHENKYQTINSGNSKVEKGSLEHSLGKPYAPKNLQIPNGLTTDFLDVKVGQVAIFCPAIFHGQELNSSKYTRVSTDLRVVDSNKTNLNIKLGKVHTGYVNVFSSPVEKMAKLYYNKQC